VDIIEPMVEAGLRSNSNCLGRLIGRGLIFLKVEGATTTEVRALVMVSVINS
jgi:hypothetical protein